MTLTIVKSCPTHHVQGRLGTVVEMLSGMHQVLNAQHSAMVY